MNIDRGPFTDQPSSERERERQRQGSGTLSLSWGTCTEKPPQQPHNDLEGPMGRGALLAP